MSENIKSDDYITKTTPFPFFMLQRKVDKMTRRTRRMSAEDSLRHPNLDFKSLQAAVERVRENGGQHDDNVHDELNAIRDTPRRNPFRARYPNFRWRFIPAVFCAFYAAMFVGGLVTYDLSGNATFAGYRIATILLAHAFLFSCAAFCWFRNYWKCGILLFGGVIALNNWIY